MPSELIPKIQAFSENRLDKDYTWLTPSTLPKFLSEKLALVWKNLYPGVHLTPHSPQTEAVHPSISWRIARRVPGKGREDSQKGSAKWEIYDKDNSEVIQVYTQYQITTYEFALVDNDVETLGRMTDAFENFMFFMQAEVQKRFVEQLLFEEEIREDLGSNSRAENAPRRVLRYTAYVQKRFELSYPMLSLIRVHTGTEIKTVVDLPVLRSDSLLYDILDISADTPLLLSVSTIPKVELDQALRNAADQGNEALAMARTQYSFIPDVDYQLTQLTSDTNLPSLVIVWKKGESANRPQPGSAYYISYHQPVEILTTTIAPGA